MLNYKYVARDPATGNKVTGEFFANNEDDVKKTIKDQGYAVISIKAEDDRGSLGLKKRVKIKDKVILSRQLATLIDAGLPLVQSLRSVSEQTKNKKLRIVITDVIQSVESGKSFSDSLAEHKEVFDPVFIHLVAAGEASGTLDTALERIANQQEKDAELVRKVRGAMIYPAIVILVMLGVVGFMIIAVLPQVKELYTGLPDTSLPFVTTLLLGVSDFVVGFWWLILLVVGLAVFVSSKWARTIGGKRYIDRYKLVIWPFGTLFRKVYMARFTRTSTTLVASGVPLLQVLEITSKAINNVHIEEAVTRTAEKVKGGKALSESLVSEPTFMQLVPQMIKIGEDSGQIEGMLGKTADYYEKEVDEQIKTISTVIEPLLMIILGVVAITIVSAVLLPIYGLVGKL